MPRRELLERNAACDLFAKAVASLGVFGFFSMDEGVLKNGYGTA